MEDDTKYRYFLSLFFQEHSNIEWYLYDYFFASANAIKGAVTRKIQGAAVGLSKLILYFSDPLL